MNFSPRDAVIFDAYGYFALTLVVLQFLSVYKQVPIFMQFGGLIVISGLPLVSEILDIGVSGQIKSGSQVLSAFYLSDILFRKIYASSKDISALMTPDILGLSWEINLTL